MTLTQDDWDSHWQSYAASAEHNPAQRYRRKLVVSLVKKARQPERIVDIGSGQGDMVAHLRSAFPSAELIGIDVSTTGTGISRGKVPSATFVQRDLLTPSPVPEDLSAWGTDAICSEVLEHVDEPDVLLANAKAYLSPGCRIVITVPGGPRSAYDTHIGHRRHYTTHSLRALLQKAGLEVEWVGRAGWPFFNIYRLLVIRRGKHLIDDVAASNRGASVLLARAIMGVFRLLFLFNLPASRWGWQMVAVARVPQSGAQERIPSTPVE